MAQSKIGTSKQIGALRKRMTEELGIYSVFRDLSPELEQQLARAAAYSDFRRVENERQLESIKSVLAGYIFNENVRVEGLDVDKNGGRVVHLNHFDVMMKATNMFLSAMNMQNKMWGLYSAPTSPNDSDPLPHKTLSAALVSEMRKLATKGNLALTAGGPRPVNSSAPDPDSRRGFKG